MTLIPILSAFGAIIATIFALLRLKYELGVLLFLAYILCMIYSKLIEIERKL